MEPYQKSIFLQIFAIGQHGELPAITQLEYFIDTDPGFGNAIDIPVTADSLLTGFTFNANLAATNPGLHILYVRSKDADGKWSLTRNQYFYKFSPLVNNGQLPAITRLEYFIDTDPGFGNAIDIPITTDSLLTGFSFNANLAATNPGLHILYIRSKDADGKWSLTRNQYFYKFSPLVNNGQLPAITRLEYFIDTDPGFGNAIDIPITTDSLLTGFSFNANLAATNPGLHILYIRSKDANGKWSLTRNQYFYKFSPLVNNGDLPPITRLEYFIDTDPGFGNATDIPITADSLLTGFTFNANLAATNPGLHILYVRSKDANGKWSLTRNQYFYKFSPLVNNGQLPAITRLEYFIDTDPGFGNAIDIPVTADSC